MDTEVPLSADQYELFKRLPIVMNSDFALSLGYSIRLLSDHPFFGPNVSDLSFFDEIYPGWISVEGLHLVHASQRTITVLIRNAKGPEGQNLPVGRVIEVLVHEVSHLVDGLFERTCIHTVDTELRAYYQDWLVGKFLHLGEPRLWEEVK